MDTKRKLSSAVVVLSLVACGTGSGPKPFPEDPDITAAKEQILATSACREDGATLNVPSEKYPTIAAGLAAARSGDTVRVAAGTYQECLVLVDGVTLSGPEVSAGQPPAATLDGAGSCHPVVLGDATILHGATMKGFRIVNPANFGVLLSGSKGIRLSGMLFGAAPGAGLRSEQASFVLEHSRFRGSQGLASVRIMQGSQAVLVGNDIAGLVNGVLVENGLFLNDPKWSPSRAWLIHNNLHDNGANGLLVRDAGSEVRGVGNQYDGNGSGVLVTGGASYVGEGEAMTNARDGFGIWVIGCELRCLDAPACPGNPVIVQEPTSAKLHKATIGNNASDGLLASCGASVEMSKTDVTANGGVGAKAQSTFFLDGTHVASVPSTIRAVDTNFSANTYSGLWLIEKGTTGQGLRNRFKGNGDGIHVTGGANYSGRDDSISGNGGGVFALGCELLCMTPDCSAPTLLLEASRVTLERAEIRNNQGQGVAAGCGAEVDLSNSVSAGNANGAAAVAYVDFGGGIDVTAPSTIRARGTVFSGNVEWGVISYDSWPDLGSMQDPGKNSFLSNGAGSIANVSPDPVLAQWNWFGTADPLAIAATIGGTNVAFEPFLSRAPSGHR